jgi:hypothetical protein
MRIVHRMPPRQLLPPIVQADVHDEGAGGRVDDTVDGLDALADVGSGRRATQLLICRFPQINDLAKVAPQHCLMDDTTCCD